MIEKVQIAAIILGSLFLIASISWLIWSSLSPSAKWQRQDLLFQICYGMYGFMDIVCIGEDGANGDVRCCVRNAGNRWRQISAQWSGDIMLLHPVSSASFQASSSTRDPQSIESSNDGRLSISSGKF